MGGKGNNIAIILLTRVNVIMRKKLEKSADLPTNKPQCAEMEWLNGTNNNMHFLDRLRGFPQMMNAWPMINPWMNPNPFQQFPNPWGRDGNQGKI